MRRFAFGILGFVVLARAVVACGGDDASDQDASLDAPHDNTTADVAKADTGNGGDSAVETGTDGSASDASDASDTSTSDASTNDATLDALAPTDAVVSDASSCIDGGIACGSGTPCCTNAASVNYGKCIIINLCK